MIVNFLSYLKSIKIPSLRRLFVYLIFIFLVKGVWIDFCFIPSGSMHPTLRQRDRLIVSKAHFGLRNPLTGHFIYRDQGTPKRGDICIFKGPKKSGWFGTDSYVKRAIGLPGDKLYFYGGQVYGLDRDGKSFHWSSDSCLTFPFGSFLDLKSYNYGQRRNSVTVHQFNIPLAKLIENEKGQLLVDRIPLHPTDEMNHEYRDLWGIGNFGMARLLSKDSLNAFFENQDLPDADLYLEISHNPSFSSIEKGADERGMPTLSPGISVSVIPLFSEQIEAIRSRLSTARFVVRKGQASLWLEPSGNTKLSTVHIGIPDGIYEWIDGRAYAVHWSGMSNALPEGHSIYQMDTDKLQLLFNLGMEFDSSYIPYLKRQRQTAKRYVFFRDGDLWLMNVPLFKEGNRTLVEFVEKEKYKGSCDETYHPFVDRGPPLKGVDIDTRMISEYGLPVPSWGYLMLGDNAAVSLDSRNFGFVPSENLRGVPFFRYWPLGSRFGVLVEAFAELRSLIRFAMLTVVFCFGYLLISHRKSITSKE